MTKRFRIVSIALVILVTLLMTSVAFAGTMTKGFYLKDGLSNGHIIGIQANVSSMSTTNLTQGNPARNVIIYSPTILALPNSCLELSVRSIRLPNMNYTAHEIGTVNSCVSPATWWNVQVMDSNFKAKYERSVTYSAISPGVGSITDKMLLVAITRSNAQNNCWGAYVWNHNTSAWDTISSNVCGTVQGREGWYGWAFFETYGYTQASSINMCTSLGDAGISQVRDMKFYRDDIPAPYVVPVTSFDHAGDSTNNAIGCFATGDWDWVSNGGNGWVVCDAIRYAYCEG